MGESPAGGMTLGAPRRRIAAFHGAEDAARGDAATFLRLAAGFGELAEAPRLGSDEDPAPEMADVLAWLATSADLAAEPRARSSDAPPNSGFPIPGPFGIL